MHSRCLSQSLRRKPTSRRRGGFSTRCTPWESIWASILSSPAASICLRCATARVTTALNACRLQKTRSSRERGGPPDIRRTSPHFVRRRSRSGRHRPLRLRRRLVSAAALYTKRRSQIVHRPPTSYNPAKKPIDLSCPRVSRPRKTARLALSARKPTWKSLTSPARLHAMTVVNGTPNLLERSHKRRTPTHMGAWLARKHRQSST